MSTIVSLLVDGEGVIKDRGLILLTLGPVRSALTALGPPILLDHPHNLLGSFLVLIHVYRIATADVEDAFEEADDG